VRGPYDDDEPDPPGGKAAERLREFLEQRFPEGVPPDSSLPEEGANDPREQPVEKEEAELPNDEETEGRPCS
jgi:hypothetical protein